MENDEAELAKIVELGNDLFFLGKDVIYKLQRNRIRHELERVSFCYIKRRLAQWETKIIKNWVREDNYHAVHQ